MNGKPRDHAFPINSNAGGNGRLRGNIRLSPLHVTRKGCSCKKDGSPSCDTLHSHQRVRLQNKHTKTGQPLRTPTACVRMRGHPRPGAASAHRGISLTAALSLLPHRLSCVHAHMRVSRSRTLHSERVISSPPRSRLVFAVRNALSQGEASRAATPQGRRTKQHQELQKARRRDARRCARSTT